MKPPVGQNFGLAQATDVREMADSNETAVRLSSIQSIGSFYIGALGGMDEWLFFAYARSAAASPKTKAGQNVP